MRDGSQRNTGKILRPFDFFRSQIYSHFLLSLAGFFEGGFLLETAMKCMMIERVQCPARLGTSTYFWLTRKE